MGAVLLHAVHRELDHAVDTGAAFEALFGAHQVAVWLDSSRAEPGLARLSVLAAGEGPLAEVLRYRVGEDAVEVTRDGVTTAEPGTVLDALRRRAATHRLDDVPPVPGDLAGGWVGVLGYELGALAGLAAAGPSPYPDAIWTGVDRLVVVDHTEARTHLLALHAGHDATDAATWTARAASTLAALPAASEVVAAPVTTPSDVPVELLDRGRERYLADVAAIHRALRDGDSYEVCLTDTLRLPRPLDDLALHRELRRRNPAPYGGLLRLAGLSLVSSSPERFLRVTRDGVAESKPIKGTVPRGPDPTADAAAATALASDPKSRAENLMIVDLLRNDLSRVCVPGTVEVPVLMGVESYATVHHLVSTVRGRLADGEDAVSCLAALFPGGSMTGAPKPRTMAIIAALEGRARGLYSGAFGYLGLAAAGSTAPVDLAMTIRSAVVSPSAVTIGGGGAVVADSDPEAEWDEMLHKVAAVWQAVAATSAGDPGRGVRRSHRLALG